MGQVIIFSAPSGSGKTTVVRRLLARYPQFEFSVSATSRAPRGTEQDGTDYYFLSADEFLNLKRIFGDDALCIFIMPPSLEELRRRLETRGTDSPEAIVRRLAKAETEIARAAEFDRVVVNDDLETAVAETTRIIDSFIRQNPQ